MENFPRYIVKLKKKKKKKEVHKSTALRYHLHMKT